MSREDVKRNSESTYVQFSDVEMDKWNNIVYPNFNFECNPAVSNNSLVPIGYPLKDLDRNPILSDEPRKYPEMDFRKLAEIGGAIDRYTHAIHKHPAIFIPHIPYYLINQFTDRNTRDGNRPLVFDPFNGSGSTGIEALVSGRDYLGIEINPLSVLVSRVATSPIPPSVLSSVKQSFVEALETTDERLYPDFDVEFPEFNEKEHWFEPEAIEGLTQIRKVTTEFRYNTPSFYNSLSPQEQAASESWDREILQQRVRRWLILMVANTVFEISNADPGVSKAYKSQSMKDLIDENEHPPDPISTHKRHVKNSATRLTRLWDGIYGTEFADTDNPEESLSKWIESEEKVNSVNVNIDIRLDDARTFNYPEYHEKADIAITSPPYINAMNYYRGTKLRLFWIADLLENDILEKEFDGDKLRRSIVGTRSVKLDDDTPELPATLKDIWMGSDSSFSSTSLPHLDEDIREIFNSDLTRAKKLSYTAWRFFARDMIDALTRTYKHLKPGALFFFIIGENTIGGRKIQSHRYVADISRNLGKFDGHQANLDFKEGFNLVGIAWDEISNHDLFYNRNHSSGIIDSEWIVILRKPTS